jgi:hypothetical protein
MDEHTATECTDEGEDRCLNPLLVVTRLDLDAR